MKLPQIYTHFKQGQVFTIDEVRCKLGTQGNTLRKRLSDLTTRGYISPIRQGLYRLCKLGESKFEKHAYCSYEIASKLTQHCYIGYKTALQFHANQKIIENESVYVISPTKFNGFTFDNRTYIWCQSSESYGLETKSLVYDGCEFHIQTTNIEKTLIDCLKRPAYCPAFDELMTLCHQLNTLPDIEKLFFYAKKINIRSIFNRLGYLLDAKQADWQIPAAVLSSLENQISQKNIDWAIFQNTGEVNRWKINCCSLR